MKKIIIIDHDGADVQLEAFGYKGKGCEEAIRQAREKLKGEVTRSEHKPEYFQAATTQTTTQKQTT